MLRFLRKFDDVFELLIKLEVIIIVIGVILYVSVDPVFIFMSIFGIIIYHITLLIDVIYYLKIGLMSFREFRVQIFIISTLLTVWIILFIAMWLTFK